jgi:pyruvate formate lyase activating enzyme
LKARTTNAKKCGRPISRREFIKRAALGAAAFAAAAYGINELLRMPRLPPISEEPPAPEDLGRWSRQAAHYIRLGENVRCGLCPNNCTLAPNQRGICRVRVNKGGTLYTLVFGNPVAENFDPVEKKPLFHFHPGSGSYSIGTAGCNLRCLNCQNWQMSQYTPEETQNKDIPPEAAVQNAIRLGAKSIAYTYNEPTVFFEYMLKSARLARQAGIRNIYVSNGYINPAPLDELCQSIDAAHIDLKSFSDDTYMRLNAGRLQPVFDTIGILHSKGVWFELIHLVVPTWTDDIGQFRDMTRWIVKNVGPDYPLHLSRFFPQYKLTNLPPTPTEYLVAARKVALEEGLHYVYVGNAPQLGFEDTICPKCGKVLVARRGYSILEKNLENGNCRYCGERIAGRWG